jgi:hypothetical protein
MSANPTDFQPFEITSGWAFKYLTENPEAFAVMPRTAYFMLEGKPNSLALEVVTDDHVVEAAQKALSFGAAAAKLILNKLLAVSV